MASTMATTEDILRRETRALVFDLYGTVVDMQSGLTATVTPFLKKKGWEGNPSSFVTWWSMIDALLDRGHTPYRQIGHRAVSQVMDRCGIAHSQDDVTWLVSQIEQLKPFPDVIRALTQLHKRYRDMLENARPHIGFPFDRFISVQEAGYFKPHFATYDAAEEIINAEWPTIERSGIIFVANHAFDCIGAKAHGFRTVFVDRRKRPFGQSPHQPDLIVANFAELAATLAPQA